MLDSQLAHSSNINTVDNHPQSQLENEIKA